MRESPICWKKVAPVRAHPAGWTPEQCRVIGTAPLTTREPLGGDSFCILCRSGTSASGKIAACPLVAQVGAFPCGSAARLAVSCFSCRWILLRRGHGCGLQLPFRSADLGCSCTELGGGRGLLDDLKRPVEPGRMGHRTTRRPGHQSRWVLPVVRHTVARRGPTTLASCARPPLRWETIGGPALTSRSLCGVCGAGPHHRSRSLGLRRTLSVQPAVPHLRSRLRIQALYSAAVESSISVACSRSVYASCTKPSWRS